jgi:hypothetical protein
MPAQRFSEQKCLAMPVENRIKSLTLPPFHPVSMVAHTENVEGINKNVLKSVLKFISNETHISTP